MMVSLSLHLQTSEYTEEFRHHWHKTWLPNPSGWHNSIKMKVMGPQRVTVVLPAAKKCKYEKPS